ncbi:MAG: haloalkane dehalogenase [Gammaproteobacteria bacterium]|nr:MAG: haloalkane dehalogenase [Gammaproteobacteria bacterium]
MTDPPADKQFVTVLDRRMAYCESGQGESGQGESGPGRTVVFLHGNPTSSYLWRNILPHVAPQAHCLAPDLIGMGDSEKLEGDDPGRYDFETHRRFLDGLLEQLLDRDRKIVFVVHDWGSALGFDWACRHPDRVAGFVYMEALVRSLTWNEWPEQIRPMFQALRGDAGEDMILDKNIFIERILPGSIQRQLSAAEMEAYRAPFPDAGEGRRVMLSWPRTLPLGGSPADVVGIIDTYAQWMASNHIPKLFINAEPGAILVGAQREFCRRWHNQTEITVPGIHFIQEDSADEIGIATVTFIQNLD